MKLINFVMPTEKVTELVRHYAELLMAGKKLLLTATPLQTSVIEIYGLTSLIDEHIFGDIKAFRKQFLHQEGDLQELRERLSNYVKRTLRHRYYISVTPEGVHLPSHLPPANRSNGYMMAFPPVSWMTNRMLCPHHNDTLQP